MGRPAKRAKKVHQHAMPSSDSDEFLYKMFKAWAKKLKKKYKTADEENERFKLWRATKERVDAVYSLDPGGVTTPLDSWADWTDFEKDQACKGIYDDPYKRTSESDESKLGKEVAEGEKMQGAGELVVGRMATRSSSRRLMEVRQHPMSSSGSDESLFKMFEDWAKKHKKRYKTADEKNERFKIWCSEKERIETLPIEPGVTHGLNFLSDFTADEIGHYYGCSLVDDPCRGNPRTPEFYESKLGKQVAEAEAEFDKWAANGSKRRSSLPISETRQGSTHSEKKILAAT